MSANNAQKTPVLRSLNRVAQQRAIDAIQLTGKALPCSVVSRDGAIVTVKFEIDSIFTLPNVRMPIAGSQYIQVPIQSGCKGVAFPADARIGGMSGLGSGTATLAQIANLSALVFFPIGNSSWAAPDDPDKLTLWGPDGAILRGPSKTGPRVEVTADGVSLIMNDSVQILMTAAGTVIKGPLVIEGAVSGVPGGGGTINFGSADVTTTGNVTSQSINLRTHTHGGVQTGGGNTGAPNP